MLLIICGLCISFTAVAAKKKVVLSVSEADAKIFVDGKMMGAGQLEVIIPSYACVNIRVEKVGYLTEVINFCNKPNYAPPPKSHFVQMRRDDAYDASVATDMANIDIEIKTSKSELEAWRLISQIITNYFDVIEVTDRETGYLRTAWSVQTFQQNTIRTRMVVKLGSADPLTYKVKLVSEESRSPQTSVKSDEAFKEWDRVLRKYKEIVNELSSRLSN